MNIDRFWLGVVAGLLAAAFIFEVVRLCERHLVFVP